MSGFFFFFIPFYSFIFITKIICTTKIIICAINHAAINCAVNGAMNYRNHAINRAVNYRNHAINRAVNYKNHAINCAINHTINRVANCAVNHVTFLSFFFIL